MPSLVAENGPLAGQRLEVLREMTIGRRDADVVIEDVKLSRLHARFRVAGETFEVEDLGSTNGTFVEDRRIDHPTRLRNGSRVKLGASLFVIEIAPVIEATQVGEMPDAGRTVLEHAPSEPGETVLRPSATTRHEPVARPEPPARPQPAAQPAAAAGAAQPAGPQTPAALPAFAPPAVRHGGLATRSWVPLAASYGTAIVVAIALVIYFASR